MVLNKYTKDLVKLAVKIAQTAENYHKDYFIGGGLAVDFSQGKISRNHHDIDFHPMLEDSKWWLEWFEDQGYGVKNRDDKNFPETYHILDDKKEAIVDMWPFKLMGDRLLIKYQGKYEDSDRKWAETKAVNFQGANIKIENPQRVLDQKIRHAKEGEPLREEDLHDLSLLGRSEEPSGF